ncbi:AbrB/MazE/SpoVT family DNA-binding domain-containing protein [bacterium]|nr:AbrB/MazE/SpoVT family DNA-binding domain-containing protein [bacterium]
MENKLQKWGNSNGVRLPKVFLEGLNLKSGDMVNIEREGEKIVITKALNKNTLKSRIEKYDGPNMSGEFIWDEAKGNELW